MLARMGCFKNLRIAKCNYLLSSNFYTGKTDFKIMYMAKKNFNFNLPGSINGSPCTQTFTHKSTSKNTKQGQQLSIKPYKFLIQYLKLTFLQLLTFSQQLKHSDVNFTLCGLLNINASLIFTV